MPCESFAPLISPTTTSPSQSYRSAPRVHNLPSTSAKCDSSTSLSSPSSLEGWPSLLWIPDHGRGETSGATKSLLDNVCNPSHLVGSHSVHQSSGICSLSSLCSPTTMQEHSDHAASADSVAQFRAEFAMSILSATSGGTGVPSSIASSMMSGPPPVPSEEQTRMLPPSLRKLRV